MFMRNDSACRCLAFTARAVARKFLRPMSVVALDERGDSLENLVRVQADDDDLRGRLHDKRHDKGDRDNNAPDTDQINDHTVLRITAAADNAGVRRHLIRHAHADNRENDQEAVRHLLRLRRQIINVQDRDADQIENQSGCDSDQQKENLKCFRIIAELILLALADRVSDDEGSGRRGALPCGFDHQEQRGRDTVRGDRAGRHMAENRVLHRVVESPQRVDDEHRDDHLHVVLREHRICPPHHIRGFQVDVFLLPDHIDDHNRRLDDPRDERSDRRSHDAHPRRAEMAVDQGVVDRAVDQQRDHGKIQRDVDDAGASKRREQNLCHREEEIGEPDHGHVPHPFLNDRLIGREGRQDQMREDRHDRKQNNRHHQCNAKRQPGQFPDRNRVFLSEILASDDDNSLADRQQQVLIDELHLIHGRNAGERRLAVRAQHHVVRQVDAQRDDILENKHDPHREEITVKPFFLYHSHNVVPCTI